MAKSKAVCGWWYVLGAVGGYVVIVSLFGGVRLIGQHLAWLAAPWVGFQAAKTLVELKRKK